MKRDWLARMLDGVSGFGKILLYGLFYILMIGAFLSPVYMIDPPWLNTWVLIIASIGASFLPPVLMLLITLTVWIISIPYAVHCDVPLFLILYILSALVYIALIVVPGVLTIISALRER